MTKYKKLRIAAAVLAVFITAIALLITYYKQPRANADTSPTWDTATFKEDTAFFKDEHVSVANYSFGNVDNEDFDEFTNDRCVSYGVFTEKYKPNNSDIVYDCYYPKLSKNGMPLEITCDDFSVIEIDYQIPYLDNDGVNYTVVSEYDEVILIHSKFENRNTYKIDFDLFNPECLAQSMGDGLNYDTNEIVIKSIRLYVASEVYPSTGFYAVSNYDFSTVMTRPSEGMFSIEGFSFVSVGGGNDSIMKYFNRDLYTIDNFENSYMASIDVIGALTETELNEFQQTSAYNAALFAANKTDYPEQNEEFKKHIAEEALQEATENSENAEQANIEK